MMSAPKTFEQFKRVCENSFGSLTDNEIRIAKKAWDMQATRITRLTQMLSAAHFSFKKIIGPEIQGLPLHKDRATDMVRKIESVLRP